LPRQRDFLPLRVVRPGDELVRRVLLAEVERLPVGPVEHTRDLAAIDLEGDIGDRSCRHDFDGADPDDQAEKQCRESE
jgi:hypothetical protein